MPAVDASYQAFKVTYPAPKSNAKTKHWSWRLIRKHTTLLDQGLQ
jgi:hypothetical protein